MRGPEHSLLSLFGAVLYGPAPGVELIPYFLSLLTWVGLALAAVLLAPIAALLRRWRSRRGRQPAPRTEPARAPGPAAQEHEGHDGGNVVT